MNDQTDQQLLRDYVERHSEAAFAVIVHRYVDLVYSAAFRMVYDVQAAKDVTQSVFALLAQNARQLTDRPALTGWLHTTARNLAAKTVRSDVRRRAREQEAVVMNELLSANPDANWEHIAPHLDDALGKLSEPDRDAVLLRYFKNHDLRTVGATLGISDDAAQKRVSRAVERLRKFFAKRGVTAGASGLAVVISTNAVQAAPVGLALAITAVTALTGTTLTTTATVTATKAIAMTALQKTIVTATIAVLAGAGIYEARQASRLREKVQTLQQQQAPLAEQNQQLSDTLSQTSDQLAALRRDNERLTQNTRELSKLRSEAEVLRNQAAESGRLQQKHDQLPTPPSESIEKKQTDDLPPSDFPKNSWAFAGYRTPEDALQTWTWAMSRGDKQTMLNSLATDARKEMEQLLAGQTEQQVAIDSIQGLAQISGYKIVERNMVSESEMSLAISVTPEDPSKAKEGSMKMKLIKIGSEWKVAGPAQ